MVFSQLFIEQEVSKDMSIRIKMLTCGEMISEEFFMKENRKAGIYDIEKYKV